MQKLAIAQLFFKIFKGTFMKIFVFYLFLVSNIFCAITLTNPIFDLSAKLSDNSQIVALESLTLTDEFDLEEDWIANTLDNNVGLANPSIGILSKILRFEQTNSNFTLITKSIIADMPFVLGSLSANITKWEIGSTSSEDAASYSFGQTASYLPKTVTTLKILDGAYLFATPSKSLIINMDLLDCAN